MCVCVCVCVSQASLDQPTQTVVMHRTEPTSLQNMALQLAEKLGGLVENNERVFDLKQGVYGGYFNRGEAASLSYLRHGRLKGLKAQVWFHVDATRGGSRTLRAPDVRLPSIVTISRGDSAARAVIGPLT